MFKKYYTILLIYLLPLCCFSQSKLVLYNNKTKDSVTIKNAYIKFIKLNSNIKLEGSIQYSNDSFFVSNKNKNTICISQDSCKKIKIQDYDKGQTASIIGFYAGGLINLTSFVLLITNLDNKKAFIILPIWAVSYLSLYLTYSGEFSMRRYKLKKYGWQVVQQK